MVGQDVSTVGRGATGRKPRSLSAGRDPRFGARFVLRVHPIASATARALTGLTSRIPPTTCTPCVQRCRTVAGPRAREKAFYRNVLVQFGPMNADARAEQFPALS